MKAFKTYREQNPGKTYFDFKAYADGGEIPPSNKPVIPEEPQPYKGKLYKDRYGRKYTESQLDDYYDNSTDEIDRFTGKPFVRGLKPVGDIEDAANMTPVGDAITAYDIYSSIKQSDWEGAGLAAMGLIPFMPMTVKQFRSKYQGITPKQKPARVKQNSYNTTVNKNYTQNRINEAINRDAANRRKVSEARNQTFNVAERLMDNMSDLIDTVLILPQYPIPSYKDGGIHIKKKNRGKFNALKKRTGKSTEELTHSKNPLTRKRAIFAQNAKKWKHKGRKKK